MEEISLHQETYRYAIERQSRNTLQLQLYAPNTLLVKSPHAFPLCDILAFIRSKADWIRRKNEVLKEPQVCSFLKDGATLFFMGKLCRLTVEKSLRKPSVKLDAGRLHVNVYAACSDDQRLLALLRSWYIAQAKRLLREKTMYWSQEIGVVVERISIKDQKTRWGSCSSLGNINYNWRIIMAPDQTIDYLVIHEVAHRVHLNHSKLFWQLVSQYCPSYLKHKTWLKVNGKQLFQIL